MKCQSHPRLAVLSLLALALSAAPSLADDGGVYDIGGGMVAPLVRHPSVRMVSETVTIRLTTARARVHCAFVFRNEGKARTVKMGFPEKSWGGGGGGGAGGKLSGFRSWVDGKPVRCVYKRGKVVFPRGKYEGEELQSWYVKDVPFGAGQTRIVEDDYATELGYATSIGLSRYEEAHSFNYILQSGRNWKGPIGHARILVDVSAIPLDHYEIDASPEGYTTGKGKLAWTLTSFEPTEDIYIGLLPRLPKLNGKVATFEEQYRWTPYSRVRGVTMSGSGFLEALGAKTYQAYRGGKEITTIQHNGHTLRLTHGSKTALLDGRAIQLQAAFGPPSQADSTIYMRCQIPTASVVRALGGKAWYSLREHRLNLWLKPAPKPVRRSKSTSGKPHLG